MLVLKSVCLVGCYFFCYDFNSVISYIPLWQASVYGIGVCAEFGGPSFKPLVGGKKIESLDSKTCCLLHLFMYMILIQLDDFCLRMLSHFSVQRH